MDDLDLGDIVLEDKQDSPKPEPQVLVKPTHVTQKEDKHVDVQQPSES